MSLVIRAGAGINTIAVDQASERGIYVANCPGKNAAAVAELESLREGERRASLRLAGVRLRRARMPLQMAVDHVKSVDLPGMTGVLNGAEVELGAFDGFCARI